MTKSIIVQAHPSLALIKYWGKLDTTENLPATSSLAISLKALLTQTRVSLATSDEVWIDGVAIPLDRYSNYFNRIRQSLETKACFHVESRNFFPTAAGLASSSSGFAALTLGCMALIQEKIDRKLASELARFGSASAARSIYGGFTLLPRGASAAIPFLSEEHWPELCVIIAIVKTSAKSISSRKAMELARTTSPYYEAWLENSEILYSKACEACQKRELEKLGMAIRASYLGMFSTMWTSSPPTIYWEPETISLIRQCERLREKGIQVWETMDAGPQVKIFSLQSDSEHVMRELQREHPQLTFLLSGSGNEATLMES